MPDEKVRIDKWLWAARFYKTRALANDAVNGGKIHFKGQRIKASRSVNVGDTYEIHRSYVRQQIIVEQLASRRGSATVAQTLYRETEESLQRQEKESEQRELARLQRPVSEHKPNKKERRQLRSFSGKD